MILEIRTYRIAEGRLDEFVEVSQRARRLVEQFGIDVVYAGPSLVPDEGEHAVLIRSFSSLAERDRQETEFYGSEAWRNGPRAALLAPIVSYHTVILDVPAAAVDALRG